MKQILLALAGLAGSLPSLSAQQTFLEVYGEVQTDINRSHELVQLDDTTFVLGGEWNEVAFLAKVNHQGTLLDYFFLDNAIPGNSSVLDLALDPGGNLVAVGECDHCVPGDTLKKVFAVHTEPSLLFINAKIYEGATPSNNLLFHPSIVRKGNQLLVAATSGGLGLNFQDFVLTAITANLDTLWRKTFNSCGNCGFDYAVDITATSSGVAVLVLNASTDSLTLYHVDDTGSLIWKKRHPAAAGSSYFKLAYRSGVIYASSTEPIAGTAPATTGGVIWRFSESSGSLLGSMSLDAPGVSDEVAGLHFSSDGTLLAVHRRVEPNSFGTYTVSRIYRVNAAASQVLDFTEIQNPDVLTSMVATGVVPMASDGTEFAASGIRGFYNRSFFFSKNGVEPPPPPGTFFSASPDTACAPATVILTNNAPGAAGYAWYLDGVLFSTEENPDPLSIAEGGVHNITLEVTQGTENLLNDFTVNSLPEIWNECAFCDNKPDPYVIIKNAAGAAVYTSGWVEDYPPTDLPVSFTMSVGETYNLEVWDYDNVGADDFFGSFSVPGDSPGGTFSLINPGDPGTPLSITFSTTPDASTSSFSQTVLVYQPSAMLSGGNVLQASPGSPAPPAYSWQWYLNGQPVPGATADTFTPTIGGSYAAGMVTAECTALSEPVVFSPALASVSLEAVTPLCFGEASGSLLAVPTGGTPPFAYSWNPSSLSGSNPSGLAAGDYAVTVTDALGQTATAQITLEQPDPLAALAIPENPACAEGSDGSILLLPSGGTAPYDFAWNLPGLSGSNPAGLAAGDYEATVTDANGCSATVAELLEAPPALTGATSSTGHFAGGQLGTATIVPDGGTPPYTYAWSDPLGQATQTATELMHGDYTVTVTDANGCTLAAMIQVEFFIAAGEVALPEVRIYPNPTAGLVFIEMEKSPARPVRFDLRDAAGRLVQREFLEKFPASINLSELAGGTYFFWMESEEGQLGGKVVLQR